MTNPSRGGDKRHASAIVRNIWSAIRRLVDRNGDPPANTNPGRGGYKSLASAKPGSPAFRKDSPPHLEDRALEALNAAVATTRMLDRDILAEKVENDLESFVDSLVATLKNGPPEAGFEDICSKPDRFVAPFCGQLKLDRNKAALTLTKTKVAVALDFQTALQTWSQAVSQYEFGISRAQETLFAAVAAAGKARVGDERQGSSSWDLYRYHTIRDAVASAVSAYQGSAATAASGLAAEAGNLLAAHADYIAAIGRAQATRLSDEAAAEQTFWQAVAAAEDPLTRG